VSDTIDTTLYGNVVFKLVQGVLGGAMFWVLGLRAGSVRNWYGTVRHASYCRRITYLGPAAIFLLIQGNWVKGDYANSRGIFGSKPNRQFSLPHPDRQ
jgi:hypothetical protein